jgi:uncharacterized protein with HEPN domain
MSGLERNLNIIIQITHYCEDIADAIKKFGNSYDNLINDIHYKNSVSMCIFQIGELSVHLTDDFKEKYNGVPWRGIRAMRNVVGHEYVRMRIDVLWETISESVPELYKYCEEILRKNNVKEYTAE